jgi:hypothetical protein
MNTEGGQIVTKEKHPEATANKAAENKEEGEESEENSKEDSEN